MSSWVGLARGVFLGALAGVALFSGCDQEAGFECGRVVPGTSSIRTCDRALEVCVCGTNSCAKKVGIPPNERAGFDGGSDANIAGAAAEREQWGECAGPGMTGYRYAEAPFARDDLAGNCVPQSDLRLGNVVPNDKDAGPGCPGQVELPDAAPSGGSGGGGGSGNAGTGGTGAGGMSGGTGEGGAGGMSGGAGQAGALQSGAGGAP